MPKLNISTWRWLRRQKYTYQYACIRTQHQSQYIYIYIYIYVHACPLPLPQYKHAHFFHSHTASVSLKCQISIHIRQSTEGCDHICNRDQVCLKAVISVRPKLSRSAHLSAQVKVQTEAIRNACWNNSA